LTSINADSTERIVGELEVESRKLADADVDVVLLAATAPTSRNGMGYDRELQERIRSASGRPAMTASTAMLEAFGLLEIERLALAAPWAEEVNKTVASFMEANGISVVNQIAMGVVRNVEVGVLDSQTAYDLACRVDCSEAQAIFLACGNWPTMDQIDRLEQKLGKPVLTTNQVSLWSALKVLEEEGPITGYGQLLVDHLAITH
jgi:maleate isomerase